MEQTRRWVNASWVNRPAKKVLVAGPLALRYRQVIPAALWPRLKAHEQFDHVGAHQVQVLASLTPPL